jgi:hypothetical protein
MDFSQNGRTIAGEYYVYLQLLDKFIRRIQRKRENMKEEETFLLHDNAAHFLENLENSPEFLEKQ